MGFNNQYGNYSNNGQNFNWNARAMNNQYEGAGYGNRYNQGYDGRGGARNFNRDDFWCCLSAFYLGWCLMDCFGSLC